MPGALMRDRSRPSRRVCTVAALSAALVGATAAAGCLRAADPATHTPATASAPARGCADRVREATIDSVLQDTALNRKWAAYMASDTGWTGGDSVYVYAVPHLGTLWTFSDAFIGNVLPNQQRDAWSWIYHNILVVSNHGGFRVVTGGTARDRRPIVSAPTRKFYLLLGGIVEGSIFQAIFQERHTTGVGSLDNVPIGSVIGTFALPSLRLLPRLADGPCLPRDPMGLIHSSFRCLDVHLRRELVRS